jgi:DNA-directed RNA polymerase subunit M/transcription elongation factor TFIIS
MLLSDRCESLFCSNCGVLVIPEVSRETAETIEKLKQLLHCDVCRPHAQALERATKQLQTLHEKVDAEEQTLAQLKKDRQYNPLYVRDH